ncbi:MAG: hypothetical protein V7L23_01970 [Nostoc sp.]|uniref:hypothetical protein n=1 Tax=Nostoc sp. TaxID=1180 RepID=UPI002FEFC2AF
MFQYWLLISRTYAGDIVQSPENVGRILSTAQVRNLLVAIVRSPRLVEKNILYQYIV